MTYPTEFHRSAGLAVAMGLALAGCGNMDLDMRGAAGGFSTSQAALQATANRPQPDDRGIISYPGYQVAVARRGDTLADVATRIGVDAAALGSFNGIRADAPLRRGEIIALPGRVAEPSPATGADGTGPIRTASVDVTTLAGQAIDNAGGDETATPAAQSRPAAPAQTGQEPVRHKVTRGETAYSIARRYDVPVRALAEWNGLDSQFTVREGQYLLIPVAKAEAPQTSTDADTAPGQGTPTPTPPSAEEPLPEDTETAASEQAAPKPETDLGERTQPASRGRFAYPVQGTIIRAYAKGRNEGINIQADAGAPVKAAEAGTVAAITESGEGVPIIVVRHQDNLLTVYANVTDVAVAKGDQVARGQTLAKLRAGDQSFVHFEVRDGFESVDPNDYLN